MTDSLGAEREGLKTPPEINCEVVVLCDKRKYRINGGHLFLFDGSPCVLCGPAALPSAPRAATNELLREALNVATDLASALFAMNGNACDDDATNALERWRKLLELEADYLRVDRGAVPLSAPEGPWKIAKPANTTGWHVSPGTPTYPMHHSLWFDTEAQALAVRDALNRVGVGAALQQEGDPP